MIIYHQRDLRKNGFHSLSDPAVIMTHLSSDMCLTMTLIIIGGQTGLVSESELIKMAEHTLRSVNHIYLQESLYQGDSSHMYLGLLILAQVVPDSYLDARPRYYPKEDVRQILQEEKMKLVQTYFETVHTSLPLLDPAAFEQGDGVGDLLLAVICEIASPFYLHKQSPNDMKVLDWIFQALPCEIRQPKLETVEASLLFLHRHARYHR